MSGRDISKKFVWHSVLPMVEPVEENLTVTNTGHIVTFLVYNVTNTTDTFIRPKLALKFETDTVTLHRLDFPVQTVSICRALEEEQQQKS